MNTIPVYRVSPFLGQEAQWPAEAPTLPDWPGTAEAPAGTAPQPGTSERSGQCPGHLSTVVWKSKASLTKHSLLGSKILYRSQRATTTGVPLDFSKAFDSLNHNITWTN